jgi:hypothetical protein
MLELFSLQPRRWEEGGPVGDVGLWWITLVQLCVSLRRIFQSVVIEKQNLFRKSRTLTGFGGFCAENNSGM